MWQNKSDQNMRIKNACDLIDQTDVKYILI